METWFLLSLRRIRIECRLPMVTQRERLGGRRFRRYFLAPLCVTMLSACGGGGPDPITTTTTSQMVPPPGPASSAHYAGPISIPAQPGAVIDLSLFFNLP